MAASAGLPLSLHHDEDNSIFLSDSEEDETPIASTRHDRKQEMDDVQKKTQEAADNVPLHPIPAMQPAFAESLVEATNTAALQKPKLRFADAKERRARLLEGHKDAKLHGEVWRFRPGQIYHELWKLMAQISFGVYLLLNGIANSNEQVVSILQDHIDEVDEFLETTMEDVKLAVEDVMERTDLLKLPMKNMATFEKMLEDRNFRLQIVTGNEKIEHIISRTRTALDATLEDLNEGMRATREFAEYLEDQVDQPWRQQRPDVTEIFDAMKGNAEGWWRAFAELQENTTNLDILLIALSQMVAEIDQRAGEVSRRTRFSVAPYSDPFSDPLDPWRSKHSSKSAAPSRRSNSGVRPTRSNTQSSQHSSNSNRESLPVFLVPASDGQASDTEEEYQQDPRPKLGQITESGHEEEDPAHDEGLYILQPRTYTPKPPEPLPSPMVHSHPEPEPEEETDEEELEEEPELEDEPEPEPEQELPKRTSLRQRVSLKGGNPPERIQVPPRHVPEAQRPSYQRAPSSLQGHDSTYGSGVEVRSASVHPAGSPYGDFRPPTIPNTIPSPLSDQQYFRPVQASPHSPLQQRPWTSGTTTIPPPRPHTSQTRNQPSRMGMSMLSNVSTMNHENKKVKKKRSAFGWLKKAFTLDEEERAEFEARKHQQMHNPYYESRSPKYLDGKRIDEYRRH